MKKILAFLLAVVSVLALAGCKDKSIDVKEITVIFFTEKQSYVHGEYNTSIPSVHGLEEGDLVPKPEDPVREGFEFIGWSKDIEGKEPWDFEKDTVSAGSIVIFAQWKEKIFTITYETSGGEISGTDYPTEFTVAKTVSLPSQVVKPGHRFRGWYTYEWVDENSTNPGDKAHISTERLKSDVTLYAHYKKVDMKITFHPQYPDGYPEDNKYEFIDEPVEYQEPVEFAIPMSTLKYKFVGWNTESDGSGQFVEFGDPYEFARSITLYGIWERI